MKVIYFYLLKATFNSDISMKEQFNFEFNGKIINFIDDFYDNSSLNNEEIKIFDIIIKNYIYSIIISKRFKFVINSENCEIGIDIFFIL